MQHTPGPWRYHVYGDGSSAVIPDVGYQVCTMPEVPPVRIAPNGRLLAAAPALLEALEAVESQLRNARMDVRVLTSLHTSEALQLARAAIQSARGEQ